MCAAKKSTKRRKKYAEAHQPPAPAVPTFTPPADDEPLPPLKDSCGVCTSGYVHIYVALPPPGPMPQWAVDAIMRSSRRRREMAERYGPDPAAWPSHHQGATVAKVGRCLCAFGRRLPNWIAGIDQLVPPDEIARLYPDGPPQVQVPESPAALMVRAGVPPACAEWTLTSYGDTVDTKQSRTVLRYAAEWIQVNRDERSDVVLYGPNGTGKTGLGVAMLRAALEGRERVRFTVMKQLAIDWRATYGRKTAEGDGRSPEQDLLKTLLEPDVLLIDEVSGTRLSEFVEDTLTMIVDMRQKAFRPTILTVNTPKDCDDPAGVLAPMVGPALFDRLRERAQFWPLEGESRRQPLMAAAEGADA